MKIEEWKSKSQAEQDSQCQRLNPYEDWDLFKAVESEFNALHGNQPGVEKVHCGLGPCMGPINSIVVDIRRGQKRTTLPERFMGFPVLKEYRKKKQNQ